MVRVTGEIVGNTFDFFRHVEHFTSQGICLRAISWWDFVKDEYLELIMTELLASFSSENGSQMCSSPFLNHWMLIDICKTFMKVILWPSGYLTIPLAVLNNYKTAFVKHTDEVMGVHDLQIKTLWSADKKNDFVTILMKAKAIFAKNWKSRDTVKTKKKNKTLYSYWTLLSRPFIWRGVAGNK